MRRVLGQGVDDVACGKRAVFSMMYMNKWRLLVITDVMSDIRRLGIRKFSRDKMCHLLHTNCVTFTFRTKFIIKIVPL